MYSAIYLRILISTLIWVVSEAETCVKKYEDDTEKIFTCDECCGGTYTRYCCLPPTPSPYEGVVLSNTYIVLIVFGCLTLIAIGFGVVLAVIWFNSQDNQKHSYTESHPPAVVIHQADVVNEDSSKGYNYNYSESNSTADTDQ